MPTYQYQCKNCGHQFEELQSFKEPELVQCPACGQDTLARVIGSGSGLIFKGSGFYLTDYKQSGEKKSTAPGKMEDKKPETPAPSSEPKPATDTPKPPTKEKD